VGTRRFRSTPFPFAGPDAAISNLKVRLIHSYVKRIFLLALNEEID
jgi:hypothetical protein